MCATVKMFDYNSNSFSNAQIYACGYSYCIDFKTSAWQALCHEKYKIIKKIVGYFSPISHGQLDYGLHV